MHTREHNVFSVIDLKISLAPIPRERTIPCNVCENSHVFRESRCYENTVCTRRLTYLFLLDDGAIFGEDIVFVLGSYDHFFSVSLFSSSSVTMSSSKPIGVGRVNRRTRNSAERLENYYNESLAFSLHNIDLVFDEENMKPERLTEAPENAGSDPGTMRVSTWYQEPTREDDDPHIPSSSRVSDVLVGTNRTSYQVREPIENDEERLAMKRGDLPPPLPKRVANPRIGEDQALHEFIRTRTLCTVLPLTTLSHKHCLIIADLFSRNLREKTV